MRIEIPQFDGRIELLYRQNDKQIIEQENERFWHAHTDKYFRNLIKSKLDCIYHFPIDLEPNRRSFGSKSIGA